VFIRLTLGGSKPEGRQAGGEGQISIGRVSHPMAQQGHLSYLPYISYISSVSPAVR